MAGLTLRFCGNFIDVAAPALGETPRKRSDSAPPCAGRKGAPIDRILHALNRAKHRYLASLGERAERIPSEIEQVQQEIASTLDPSVGAKAGTCVELGHPSEGVGDCPASDSTDVPGTPPTPDPQSQFEHDWVASTNPMSKPITTLMFRNLPCRLSPQDVVNVIDEQGFSDAFDLFYLPPPKGVRSRKRLHRNQGFAFLNFKTPEYATAFEIHFNRFAFLNCNSSTKLSYTTPARQQGFEANWNESFKDFKARDACVVLRR